MGRSRIYATKNVSSGNMVSRPARTPREGLSDAMGTGDKRFVVKSFFFALITARKTISTKALNWVNS